MDTGWNRMVPRQGSMSDRRLKMTPPMPGPAASQAPLTVGRSSVSSYRRVGRPARLLESQRKSAKASWTPRLSHRCIYSTVGGVGRCVGGVPALNRLYPEAELKGSPGGVLHVWSRR